MGKLRKKMVEIAAFSNLIKQAVSDNDKLFDIIQLIKPETNDRLYNKYINSKGPVTSIRKDLASQLKEGSINRLAINQSFASGKKEFPKKFTQYKNLFSILYPFLTSEKNNLVYETFYDLTESLRKDLNIMSATSVKTVAFDGARNTGSERVWFAIFNKNHQNQKTAKQLFLSFDDDYVWYALYDRPNDKILFSKREVVQEFKYGNVLSFFKEHVEVILKDTNGLITSSNIISATSTEEILFKNWLLNNHIQITKPEKYVSAVKTISNDLKGTIAIESIYNIKDISELKKIHTLYNETPDLIAKNSRGNSMYSRALDLYIEYISDDQNTTSKDIIEIINNDQSPKEKQILILARIGQGQFRKELIEIWNGCSISNYTDVSLLIASHIKPWCKCENHEKIDPYNGLLLLPNYDKLFDRGYISFDEDGFIIISKRLDKPEIFGITNNMNIELTEDNKRYMKYHREEVFK